MPKPIEEMTGREKIEEVASTDAATEVKQLLQSVTREVLGAELAEMKAEMAAIRKEVAQKTLEGKPEEAATPDEGNVYGRDMVALMQRLAANQAPVEEPGAGAIKALAKSAFYLARADGVRHVARDLMERDGATKGELEIASKAMGIDNATAGGNLLQGDMADDVISEFLSETAIVSDGAIQRIPVAGSIDFPYVTSGPTTYSRAENGATTASELAVDKVILTPKEQTVIVPASRKMLASVAKGAQLIEQEMRRSLAVDVDAKLLRGAGVSNEPRGLRYWAASANLLNANGTVSAANVVADLGRMEQALQAGNFGFMPGSSRFAISPRTARYLRDIVFSSNFLFRAEMLTGTLNGIELAGASKRGISAIPENLAVTGSSESEVYLYDTQWLVMALGEALTLEFSTEAAYTDSSGTLVSAFDRHQAVWKLNMGMDFGDRARGLSIACIIDCDWGA